MTGPIVRMLAALIAALFAMPASGATPAVPAQQATTLAYITASAAPQGTAETRVRASAVAAEVPVGPPESVVAGQRLGEAGPRVVDVVATGVAAKSLPTLEIDASRMPNIAKNVQSALDEGHPGILSRTTDSSLIRSNRAAACEGFCGPGSPDEYPFASTLQGGAGARVAGVPIGEQRIQGGVLSSFYQKYGIGEGDFFRVIVSGLE